MNKQKDDEFLFTWLIENISTSFQSKGDCICSPSFAQDFLFDVKWYLKLYPQAEGDQENPSICLTRNKDISGNWKIKFYTQVMNCTESIIFNSKGKMTEYQHNSGLGTRIYIRKHLNLLSLPSNILIIKCCLKVCGYEKRKTYLPLPHDNGLFTDITLRAGDIPFKAHKAVLWARWPKLVEKLNAEQTNEQTFDMGSNVLEAIMKYVYTGSIDYTNSDLLEELAAAAIKHELPNVGGIPVVAQKGRTRIDVHKISFEWPIEDLSNLPTDTVLHHTFSVNILQSFKWKLIIHVREKTEKGSNYDISVSRADDHESTPIFVRCKIYSIEKQEYPEYEHLLESSETWKCAEAFHIVSRNPKAGLLKCEFAFSNCNYISEIVESSFVFSSATNVHNLSSDFQNLYKSGIFSDVNIIVGSKTLPVHKGFLCARSSVFSKMFETNMTEMENNNVNISDVDPDVMEEFLLFIYSGNLEKPLNKTAAELYAVADKYDIPVLKKKCSSFLKSNLSLGNVLEVLLLATMHCDDDLYKSVIDFSAAHSQEVFSTPQWQDIAKDNMWVKVLHDVIVHKKF